MGQDCRVRLGDAHCRAPPGPWPRQCRAGLSYLRLPCCFSDLPGGLQSAASSPLQFRKVGVSDALAPAVPLRQHSSSAETAAPPTLDISLWAKSSSETQSPKSTPSFEWGRIWLLLSKDTQLPSRRSLRGIKTVPPCPPWEQDLDVPPLPVTDVSFLCIKWRCSWCLWPAMQKGQLILDSFSLTSGNIAPRATCPGETAMPSASLCQPQSYPHGDAPNPDPVPCLHAVPWGTSGLSQGEGNPFPGQPTPPAPGKPRVH